jgi:hypothetical protein
MEEGALENLGHRTAMQGILDAGANPSTMGFLPEMMQTLRSRFIDRGLTRTPQPGAYWSHIVDSVGPIPEGQMLIPLGSVKDAESIRTNTRVRVGDKFYHPGKKEFWREVLANSARVPKEHQKTAAEALSRWFKGEGLAEDVVEDLRPLGKKMRAVEELTALRNEMTGDSPTHKRAKRRGTRYDPQSAANMLWMVKWLTVSSDFYKNQYKGLTFAGNSMPRLGTNDRKLFYAKNFNRDPNSHHTVMNHKDVVALQRDVDGDSMFFHGTLPEEFIRELDTMSKVKPTRDAFEYKTLSDTEGFSSMAEYTKAQWDYSGQIGRPANWMRYLTIIANRGISAEVDGIKFGGDFDGVKNQAEFLKLVSEKMTGHVRDGFLQKEFSVYDMIFMAGKAFQDSKKGRVKKFWADGEWGEVLFDAVFPAFKDGEQVKFSEMEFKGNEALFAARGKFRRALQNSWFETIRSVKKEPMVGADKKLLPMQSYFEMADKIAPYQITPFGGKTRAFSVISGGQIGADRLGLEVAKELGLKTGGTAPKGFKTSRGADKSLRDFGLTEISDQQTKDYQGRENFYGPRTEQNIINSDYTLLFGSPESPGSRLTVSLARKHGKRILINPSPEQFAELVSKEGTGTINIAGNRSFKDRAMIKKVIEAGLKAKPGKRSGGRMTVQVPESRGKPDKMVGVNLDVARPPVISYNNGRVEMDTHATTSERILHVIHNTMGRMFFPRAEDLPTAGELAVDPAIRKMVALAEKEGRTLSIEDAARSVREELLERVEGEEAKYSQRTHKIFRDYTIPLLDGLKDRGKGNMTRTSFFSEATKLITMNNELGRIASRNRNKDASWLISKKAGNARARIMERFPEVEFKEPKKQPKDAEESWEVFGLRAEDIKVLQRDIVDEYMNPRQWRRYNLKNEHFRELDSQMYDRTGQLTEEGAEALVVTWFRQHLGVPSIEKDRFAVLEPKLYWADGKMETAMLPRHFIDTAIYEHAGAFRATTRTIRKLRGQWGRDLVGTEAMDLVTFVDKNGRHLMVSRRGLMRVAEPGSELMAIAMGTSPDRMYRYEDMPSPELDNLLKRAAAETSTHPDDIVALRLYNRAMKEKNEKARSANELNDAVAEKNLRDARDKDLCP